LIREGDHRPTPGDAVSAAEGRGPGPAWNLFQLLAGRASLGRPVSV